jgi:hypothetical protein
MVRGQGDRWLQVGVVSWGHSCGLTLTAYSRVANYRTWIDGLAGPAPFSGFTDVAGDPHEAAILAVAGAGIAGGYPDGTYRPSATVTRGQMATFLMRALKLPAGPPAPFSDAAGSAHAAGIDAVAAAGIAGGYPDGTYRPGAPVTRGQMATFLTRALQLPVSTVVPFSDLEGNAHAPSIAAVAAAGIAGGYSDGTYRPEASVTRGQMATFLFRAVL